MLKTINKHLLILLPLVLVACSNQSPRISQPLNTNQETGIASFYADKYQSRQTASGEPFDQNKRTAAHKKLAFGTWVKVTNINNGRNVVVKINDRGPFIRGRIIDLSKSAFNAIGSINSGLIKVSIEVIR